MNVTVITNCIAKNATTNIRLDMLSSLLFIVYGCLVYHYTC